MTPASFPYATMDPVAVTAPIKTPIKTSTSWMIISALLSPTGGERAELIPIKTAAKPTKL